MNQSSTSILVSSAPMAQLAGVVLVVDDDISVRESVELLLQAGLRRSLLHLRGSPQPLAQMLLEVCAGSQQASKTIGIPRLESGLGYVISN